MKLTDLQEAKLAKRDILSAYDVVFNALENDDAIDEVPNQLTSDLRLGYFDIHQSDDETMAFMSVRPSARLVAESALHTSCPICKARRGKPCVTSSGRKATRPHEKRLVKLKAEDLIKMRDFQLAVSFVKKFLKRHNLPFTKVIPVVQEWGGFSIKIEHPELAVSNRHEFELI